MNYQSAARNPRTKGFKVKRAFQFALILAICIWLLYQIKHSHDKTKDNVGNIQRKLNEEHGASILGRKGNSGWSSGESDFNLDDGGARDDELDKDPKEKFEEESYPKENESVHENVAGNGRKQDQKELERQYEKFQINDNNNSDIQIGGGVEVVNINKDMYKEEVSSKGREAVEASNEDKDTTVEVEKKISVNSSGNDNATVSGHSEMEEGEHSFHDENGVPQGVDKILESMSTEKSGDKKDFLRQNMISSSNNHGKVNESMPEGEEVESIKGTNVADAESGSHSS